MRLKFMLSLIAGFILIFSGTAALSGEMDKLGPAVGDALPHDLSVNSQPAYSELTGEKGAVIFFVRSISWCPYCKNQVINISSNAAEFEARGRSLIYISYDAAADQAQFGTSKNLNGTFVSDTNSEIIDAFGLRNTDYDEEHFAHGAPHPAIFFVSPDGVIQAKLYEEDYLENRRSYQNRPALDIILETADDIGAAG